MMRLRVDLLPRAGQGFTPYADTVLVVDVLRATTTALVYLERGAEALHLVADLGQALEQRREGAILAGERGGLPPVGFDLGNSPLEAEQWRFDNQIVVMSTSNGTAAADLACQSGQRVFLACLRNAHAAARRARERAAEEVAILCAGSDGRVGLDDIYTAGVLTEYLLAFGEWQLDDGARIALTVRRQFADPLEPLRLSRAAGHLHNIGLDADVHYCAQISQSSLVPTFTERLGEAGQVLVFRSA
jgi:2-phosphosulfolactate phosphatase